MHYKSSPKEPLLCDSFARKFSDRYSEPAEYALYAKFKALIINQILKTHKKRYFIKSHIYHYLKEQIN